MNFSIHIDKKILCLGLISLAAGFFMYLLMKNSVYSIYDCMKLASSEEDSSYLLTAMMQLILMNCIRTTPVYLGTILIVEALEIKVFHRCLVVLKVFISMGVMFLTYTLMELTVGISYHFGIPAVIILVLISFLERKKLFEVSIFSKGVIIAFVILTVQTLTVIPGLTIYGFGKGEMAVDIKQLSVLLGYGDILSRFSILLFSVILIFLLIIIKLVNDEFQLKESAVQREQMEKKLMSSRLEALELRTLKEIQNLVHDLKTPLTTIQGLASLSEYLEKDERIGEYQSRIMASVDTMNGMISEILYEDKKTSVSVKEILKAISSYVAINETINKYVTYENTCPDKMILANKIRLIRAIINVIENAAAAVMELEESKAQILVRADMDQGQVRICVTDNGVGIKATDLENIWEIGHSSKGSTGLGLSFTRNVIHSHGGKINIESSKEKMQTCVSIWLREVQDEKADCNC